MAATESYEDIISMILANKNELQRGDVLSLIEEKKKAAGGLLSDEGAARILAQELSISLEIEPVDLDIAELSPGLGKVTVEGEFWARGISLSSLGESGTQRFFLQDETGLISCSITGHPDLTEISSKPPSRQVIKLAVVRVGSTVSGRPQIEVDEHSRLLISKPRPTSFHLDQWVSPIAKTSLQTYHISVIGRISTGHRKTTFSRNGKEGLVTRFSLSDASGAITVVAWNNRAEAALSAKKGDILLIQGGRVKTGLTGGLELHIDDVADIFKIEEMTPEEKPSPLPVKKVSELMPSGGPVDILARVLAVGELNSIVKDDRTLVLRRLLLSDETGIIAVVLWGRLAASSEIPHAGQVVLIEGASVRERNGELSLSLGESSIITVRKDQEIGPPPIKSPSGIMPAKFLVAVEGMLEDPPQKKQVQTSSGENIEMATCLLKDDRSVVRAVFWREQSKLVENLSVPRRVRILGVAVRPGLGGVFELFSTGLTSIETVESNNRISTKL